MSANVEPVIAGSRGFALALLAPLTERIGTRPRIAADAAALRPFCTGPAGLVVVEFLGADTLRAIEALVGELKHLRVVAAVPETLAAVDAPLRALGVEVARWDGTAGPVVGAVDRQLALAAAAWPPRAAIPASAPAHPPPVRSPPGAAVPVTHPPPARATPARATPPPSPHAHAPPVRPSPAHPPPAPAPAAESQRTPGAPATAVAARLGVIVPAPSQASTVAPHPPPGSPAPAAASSAPAAAATPASEAGEASVRSMGGGSVYRPPPPPAAWPASVPGAMEAADALREALSGASPAADSPLAYVAEVVASLSDVERAVLSGAPQPFDAEPIRDAAVMRVRVAAALATAPGGGDAAPVDGAAVSALLADIDALLARVSALAEGAPEHVQASLEAVRNALVREAIDFSEAVQRASAGGTGVDLAKRATADRAPPTRIVSTDVEMAAPGPRRVAGWIALAIVVALAAGHRAWTWHVRETARAALAAGLPAGLTEIPRVAGGQRVLVRVSTVEAPDVAEVARWKAAEEARGNTVREADGMIFVAPAAPVPAANAEP